MQSPENSRLFGTYVIVLNKVDPDAVFFKHLFIKGFHKKTASVLKHFGLDNKESWKTGFLNHHPHPLQSSLLSELRSDPILANASLSGPSDEVLAILILFQRFCQSQKLIRINIT